MISAQEQVDEAAAAMDTIIREVESLEKDHTKHKVPSSIPSSDDT
jgi:hypothetical protein